MPTNTDIERNQMKLEYVCNDCGREISSNEYEEQSDIFCRECGGHIEKNTKKIWCFSDKKGQLKGPFYVSDLREAFLNKEIHEQTEIFNLGSFDWKPLSKWRDLEPVSKALNSKDNQQKQEYFTFSCLSCGKSLRVAFPFQSLFFRCGSCSGMYDICSVNSGRQIYLVVPKLSHKTSNPPPRPPAMPEEVRRALRIFAFKEDVSWEDVKAMYRKCMSEYHPDKVTHLGADLRKLAEEKTKAYNAAYSDIQRYFEKVDNQGA